VVDRVSGPARQGMGLGPVPGDKVFGVHCHRMGRVGRSYRHEVVLDIRLGWEDRVSRLGDKVDFEELHVVAGLGLRSSHLRTCLRIRS